ncbi:hypothetical protein [Candidatus Uabimicrobium amorphum]|nr:hypothetical protein [Candidatus Uabimicrobium amorphum]
MKNLDAKGHHGLFLYGILMVVKSLSEIPEKFEHIKSDFLLLRHKKSGKEIVHAPHGLKLEDAKKRDIASLIKTNACELLLHSEAPDSVCLLTVPKNTFVLTWGHAIVFSDGKNKKHTHLCISLQVDNDLEHSVIRDIWLASNHEEKVEYTDSKIQMKKLHSCCIRWLKKVEYNKLRPSSPKRKMWEVVPKNNRIRK